MRDEQKDTKRIAWIDCTKFVAILGVVVDHCNGYLYINPYIAYASYYSVSLFVLLAGISVWISFARGKEISFSRQLAKVGKLLTAYAVASFVVMCATQRRFDLVTYLNFLVNFNIQPPYYYLVFFMQLLIVAPIMVKWCAFVNTKKYKWLMQFGTMAGLGWLAYVCIHYSFILPVHGGGKFGGGGTYIILYYAGMLLASNGTIIKGVRSRLVVMVFSLSLSAVWVVCMTEGRLPFDRWMSPYWGDGLNPPSVNLMVYSLFILFFATYFFRFYLNVKTISYGSLCKFLGF